MNILVKSEHIQTKAACKENFYYAFKAKVKEASLDSTDGHINRHPIFLWIENGFYGHIDDYQFWIQKPFSLGFLMSYRIFFGSYSEEDGAVVVVGDFEYPRRRKMGNCIACVVAAFIGYLVFHAYFSVFLSLLFSLGIGAGVCGLLFGATILVSRPSEKEVVKLLSSLG